MGILTRVVRIRRRVVAPEDVAGRSVMVERRPRLGRGSLGTLDVLVSSAVPFGLRGALAEAVLRQIVRRAVANDMDAAGPDSRVSAARVYAGGG